MSTPAQRAKVLALLDEAVAAGARLGRACQVLGSTARTVQRWRRGGLEDQRPHAQRPRPANALSPEERERALALLCSPQWCDLSPKQVVPRLADEGLFTASESQAEIPQEAEAGVRTFGWRLRRLFGGE